MDNSMTRQGAIIHGDGGVDPFSTARVRVHTPGKHIVLFFAAAIVIFFGIMSFIKSSEEAVSSDSSTEIFRMGQTFYIPLEDFLVDLSPDRDGRVTYLKLSVSITVEGNQNAEITSAIESKLPEIEERIVFLLRALRPEDFDGTENLERIKEELLRRVNIVIAPAAASDVVINELVIQ